MSTTVILFEGEKKRFELYQGLGRGTYKVLTCDSSECILFPSDPRKAYDLFPFLPEYLF